MDELELLGYETPKIIKHKNGIEICVPEDKKSDKWCVHIPSNLINNDMFINGMDYYFISYWMVVNIVKEYASKGEQDKYWEYTLKQREKKSINTQRKDTCFTKVKKKHLYYDKVIELRKQGLTYQEIGDMLGYTKQYIYNIAKIL